MRRLIALFVLWIGLVGAGSSAFACATAAATGDCCPPGTDAGCSQTYEQLAVDAAIGCVTAAAPSRVVQRDCGSADPVAPAAAVRALVDFGHLPCCEAPRACPARTDASLTYLHTGRLRL
jgi:hypothetical protein